MQQYRLGFLMEQALGHISYARNLRRWLRRDESIDATVMPVRPFVRDFYQRLYRVSNWSVVASLRAREQVRRHGGPGAFDALLYHTQITTLFSLRIMRRVPTVVSLDATPFNMDDLAHAYDKRPSGDSKVAGLKYRWNAATFRAGAAITTWSAWAKESVVRDYGVAGEKVTVIPPGVDLNVWRPGPSKARSNGNDSAPTRLLFVGGQFARKGGPALIEAFRALPESCELDLVTKDRDAERAAGAFGGRVRVHGEMLANSAELRDLYARADLFVLPTRGDCTPVAVIEALAAGLPVVATKLAGIPEQVEDGTNGLLVPPDDAAALAGALRTLVDDAPRRRNMANAARRRAEQAFDGEVNCRALTTLMKRCVDHHQHSLSRSRERG